MFGVMGSATSLNNGLNSGWQVIEILLNASVGFADGEARSGVLPLPSIMRPCRPHIASKIYPLKVRPTWEKYGPRQDPRAGLGKAEEARAEMISFNRLDSYLCTRASSHSGTQDPHAAMFMQHPRQRQGLVAPYPVSPVIVSLYPMSGAEPAR